MNDLVARDRRLLWHPYTQHASERSPTAIGRAKGASLFEAGTGREIIDLNSSWWTCIHGHSHPTLNKALCDQVEAFEHVMFAGFTHQPAVDLADLLTQRLGHGLSRVFYSDDGSTANEVALKMAYQVWRNRGDHKRRLFVAFDGDYHGDTMGAMAVSKGAGFFNLFDDLLCEARTIPYAPTFEGDEHVIDRENTALKAFDEMLAREGDEIAALILEPLMQGAAGMRFCRPSFLRAVVERARAHDILVIFDEVATGFGRTGTLFAFEQTGIAPDIICLSKGLTSGYMALAATVVREDLFEMFTGDGFDRALAHGHSFTANPLACSVALKSLQLFEEDNTLARIAQIAQKHKDLLPRLQAHPRIEKARLLGTVLAFDLADGTAGYKSDESLFLRDWYLARGFNIRPYGKTIYLIPPYCITDEQLDAGHEAMLEGLAQLQRG